MPNKDDSQNPRPYLQRTSFYFEFLILGSISPYSNHNLVICIHLKNCSITVVPLAFDEVRLVVINYYHHAPSRDSGRKVGKLSFS